MKKVVFTDLKYGGEAIMYGIRGLLRKPYWTKTSQAFYERILDYIDHNDDILEFGSSTGHISMRLAWGGYKITILDDRADIIRQAEKIYKFYGVSASLVTSDFFQHNHHYDFIWNSGLIQCFNDENKAKLIEHMFKISGRALLFYPDTDGEGKILGSNSLQHPGVGDSMEYSVKNVLDISKGYYNNVEKGRISSSLINMPFDMLWVYMEKQK